MGAGDEPGVLAAQEGDDPAEVAGVADESGRDARRRSCGERVAVQGGDPAGGVQPGLDRVHGDPVAGDLGGHGLEERGGAGAGGVRQDQVGHRLTDRQRGDRHHPTPAGGTHRRDRRLAHADDAHQVEVDRRRIAVHRRGLEVPGRRPSGVGDEDVDATEGLVRRGDEGRASGRIGDVLGDRQAPAADARRGVLDARLVTSADRHRDTVRGQGLCAGEAESGGSGGDRGAPSGDAEIHAPHDNRGHVRSLRVDRRRRSARAPPRCHRRRRPVSVLVRRRRRTRQQPHPRAHRELRPVRRRRRLHRAVDGDHRQGARPDRDVVLIDAHEVGSAASGRNGGFMESSLTHGVANGQSRFGDELPLLEELGLDNLDEIEAAINRYGIDCDYERTGVIDVATTAHPRVVPRRAARRLPAAALPRPEGRVARPRGDARPGRLADVHGWAVAQGPRRDRRSGPAGVGPQGRGRPRSACASTRTPRRVGSRRTASACSCPRRSAGFGRPRWRWRRTPSSRCCRRLGHYVAPVYDYCLVTEPLSAAQLASIGWANRQGLSDIPNQFHYYRLTEDNRDPVGRLRRHLLLARQGQRRATRAGRSRGPSSAGTSSRPSRSSRDCSFTHAWGGVIDTCSRFCVFWGQAMQGRVAYALGYTGLGVAASRFGGEVMLDLLDGRRSQGHADRVRAEQAAALPAGAVPLRRHPGDPLVAGPRGPHRQAQPLAAHASTASASASTRSVRHERRRTTMLSAGTQPSS